MSQRSCDQTLALMKETHPIGNLIPKDFYRAKKLVSKLGLTAKKLIVVLMVVCYFTLMKK